MERWLQAIWYQGAFAPYTLRLLAAVFAMLAALRHGLYRTGVLRKTFLFLELADIATIRWPDESIDAWLTRLNRNRTPADVLRRAAKYNLGDPYGRGKKRITYATTQITQASERIVETVAG